MQENSVSSILEHTTQHGAIKGKTQTKNVKFYNLDAIIAVGYRVDSKTATQFRIWATERLKEYTIKGFIMYMKDWTKKLNAFLKFNEEEILTNTGKVSHKVAEALAMKEYDKFKKIQDKNYVSDFDKEIKKILKKF